MNFAFMLVQMMVYVIFLFIAYRAISEYLIKKYPEKHEDISWGLKSLVIVLLVAGCYQVFSTSGPRNTLDNAGNYKPDVNQATVIGDVPELVPNVDRRGIFDDRL